MGGATLLCPVSSRSYALLMVYFVTFGFAEGSSATPINYVILNCVPVTHRSKSFGFWLFFLSLTMAVGPPFAGIKLQADNPVSVTTCENYERIVVRLRIKALKIKRFSTCVETSNKGKEMSLYQRLTVFYLSMLFKMPFYRNSPDRFTKDFQTTMDWKCYYSVLVTARQPFMLLYSMFYHSTHPQNGPPEIKQQKFSF